MKKENYTKKEVAKIKLLSYQKGYKAGVKKGEDNVKNGLGYQLKMQS